MNLFLLNQTNKNLLLSENKVHQNDTPVKAYLQSLSHFSHVSLNNLIIEDDLLCLTIL